MHFSRKQSMSMSVDSIWNKTTAGKSVLDYVWTEAGEMDDNAWTRRSKSFKWKKTKTMQTQLGTIIWIIVRCLGGQFLSKMRFDTKFATKENV